MKEDVSLWRRVVKLFEAWRAGQFPNIETRQRYSVAARWVVPTTLWLGSATVATVAQALFAPSVGPIWSSAFYWFGLLGLAIWSATVVSRRVNDVPFARRRLIWAAFAAFWAVLLTVLNAAINPNYASPVYAAYSAVIVATLTWTYLVVRRSLAAQSPDPTPDAAPMRPDDPEQAFLGHVPQDFRAPLLRIEAQDHYLKIVTEAGTTTILMRFVDALALLAECEGEQVHRSHWVATRAITAVDSSAGRDFIVASDGTRVPVSRSHRARLRQSGFIRTH